MAALNTNDLLRIFEKLDKNGDGLLSLDELNRLLERIGVHLSLDDLESSIGKSSLDLNEFLSFYDSISGQGRDEEDDLVEAFKVFDVNGDGFISSEELESVLSRLGLRDEKSGNDCRSMIRVYDTNLDGVIDFEEFKQMMLDKTSSSSSS